MNCEANMTAEQKKLAIQVLKIIGVEGLTIDDLFADLREFTGRYEANVEFELKPLNKAVSV